MSKRDDIIAEARNHVEHFPLSEGDAIRVTRLADALASTATDVERLERENAELRKDALRWHDEMMAAAGKQLDADAERDAALAVIERVRTALPLEVEGNVCWYAMKPFMEAAISTSPAEALNAVKAAAWDEGYTTGNRHDGRRDANPYRTGAN